MMKEFDIDGFSKMSRVHASKKPLTVAKAPSFGRSTSRVGQTTTSETDTPRKDSQTKSIQPVKPTQTSRVDTPGRFPRTATPTTPTQSSSRVSKAGVPIRNKTPVTSPKRIVPGKSLANINTPNGVLSPSSKDAAPELDEHKPNESGEYTTNDSNSKDENPDGDPPREKDIPDKQRVEELKDMITIKDGEIEHLQAEIQGLQTTKDAEIQQLKAQIKDTQASSEHKNEGTDAALLAQIANLESELDDARKKTSGIEAAHRKTQDEQNKILPLNDKEVQERSETARGQRGDQEVKDSGSSLKGEFQGLQIKHKRELDEVEAAALEKVEAMQVEHDELLQSRDQEIKEMSDLVQELQGMVEKAHQADKDELKEAQKRHEQGSRNATAKYEVLQEKVLQLEQKLLDDAAKHVQEKHNLEEEHQTRFNDANQRHEQETRNAASKYQQELESLMLTHHEEIKAARTKNEQAAKDSAVEHRQEIEALIANQKEELETAAARQEQAVFDIAAKYQQDFKSLEAKHLDELRTVTTKDEEESVTLADKHQCESQAMAAKHQEELEQIIRKNDDESSNAAIKSRQAVEDLIAKHREEIASAKTQIEELKVVNQKHQQEIGEVGTNHKEELEQITHHYQEELHKVTVQYDQKLEKSEAGYKELEGASLQREQKLQEAVQAHRNETQQLQSQLETAADKTHSLEMMLKDLKLRKEDSVQEAASKHEQELQAANIQYEEELQSLRTMYATAVEEITTLRRKTEDVERKQSVSVEEELQSLRTIYATAVEEITALRRKVEDVDQKRSEAVDEAASLKASLDDLDLKRSEAVRQVAFPRGNAEDEELEQREAAIETALLRDKLELADRRFEQDQQAVADLQRQIRVLQVQNAELSTDTKIDRTEAAVDVAIFKDKLELANLEIHLHKGTISGLQNEVERLQTQLAELSADTRLDQNEAIVDVTLLKDKLELADIQIRQARGTVSNLQEEIEGLKAQITNSTTGIDLDQNEAAVENALLKNTLELANLENRQDKATIATLQKQVEELQAQVDDAPRTGSYTCHQLRGEMSMLGRHQAAQMTDLEALKADMAAESELREQDWKKRADVWDRLASELQGMTTQLAGTTGEKRSSIHVIPSGPDT